MEQSAPNLPALQRESRSKSKLKFSDLKRSQSQSCTVRSTIPSSGSRRYQNVQKIAMLIEDIKSKDLPKGQKAHEAVVQGFKQKIRNTFNQLYGNYEQNKEIINHEIKTLEKNKTSHIEMSAKFEQTLKEKNQYDKLRLEVDIKSKKLMKLREVLERERNAMSEKDIIVEELKTRIQQLKEQHREIDNLDYQKGVLENMRVSRRVLKESLKMRFNECYDEFSERERKIKKFYNENEVKKRLVADLAKQMPGETIDIPENFAIELENKLEHLYGKEAFQNIFYHESIINEEANREEKEREIEEREARRKVKEQLEREEKRELDRVEGEYIKNRELEENFLKQCGIRSLSEIVEYRGGQSREELEILKEELSSRIQEIDSENAEINEQIRRVLSRNVDIQVTIRDVQKDYLTQHQQQKKLSYIGAKNSQLLQSLQAIIDRITEQPGPIQDMNLKLAKFSSRLEKISEWKVRKEEKRKVVKIPELEIGKNETENTVIMDKEEEYLEEHIQSLRNK